MPFSLEHILGLAEGAGVPSSPAPAASARPGWLAQGQKAALLGGASGERKHGLLPLSKESLWELAARDAEGVASEAIELHGIQCSWKARAQESALGMSGRRNRAQAGAGSENGRASGEEHKRLCDGFDLGPERL